MTYEEFKLAVREHLPLNNRRQGAQTFLDRQILNGLLDLQFHIPLLRPNVEGPVVRTFSNSDTASLFNEDTAAAVAMFVQAELSRLVDGDMQMAASFRGDYKLKRQALFIDAKEPDRCATLDFEVRHGDSMSLRFTLSVDGSGSTVRSLVGWSVKWMVKQSESDPDDAAVLVRSVADGSITVSGNTAALHISGDETKALNPRLNYYHALKVTSSEGNERTLHAGRLRLIPAAVQQSAAA